MEANGCLQNALRNNLNFLPNPHLQLSVNCLCVLHASLDQYTFKRFCSSIAILNTSGPGCSWTSCPNKEFTVWDYNSSQPADAPGTHLSKVSIHFELHSETLEATGSMKTTKREFLASAIWVSKKVKIWNCFPKAAVYLTHNRLRGEICLSDIRVQVPRNRRAVVLRWSRKKVANLNGLATSTSKFTDSIASSIRNSSSANIEIFFQEFPNARYLLPRLLNLWFRHDMVVKSLKPPFQPNIEQ